MSRKVEKTPPTIDRDTFCWKCHRKCENEVDCSECVLTFHLGCLENPKLVSPNWQCTECEQMSQCLNEERNLDNISKLLGCAIDCIIRKNNSLMNDKFQIPNGYSESHLLMYPITLMDIKQKAKNGGYYCTTGLLHDIKWLVHNCMILIIECKDRRLVDNKLDRVKKLLELSLGEISWLKACTECYTRGQPEFLIPCSKPHLLLWVQYDGEYWPAKLMHIGQDATSIDVQFFAEFSSAEVSVDDCLLFSRQDPNSWRRKKQTALFKKAVSDVHKHIKQIEVIFGDFKFAPAKTKLVIANVEEHLDDMVPGYRDLSKRPKNDRIDTELNTKNEPIQQLQHQPHYDEPENIVKTEPIVQQDNQAVNVERCTIGSVEALPNRLQIRNQRNEYEEYVRTLKENQQLLQEENQQLKQEYEKLQQDNQRQNLKIRNLELELGISNKALIEQRKQFIRRQQEERSERLHQEEPMEKKWKQNPH